MREMYRNQRDALVAALRRRLGDHLTVDPPDQGMHLVAYVLGNGPPYQNQRL
jgi:GntR family transcriptional regulator / MocR family aminotransferase